MGDFDIEAYLEEQVDGKSKLNETISSKTDSRNTASHQSERKNSSRSRDKDSRRRRDRSRSGSREGKRRHRSSSRERDRDRDRDRDRKKSTPETEEEIAQRKIREQQREAELLMERDIAKKKREIDDLTKDQRTILVGQLTMKVNESDLRRFFTQIGKVNSVIMIRDKHTGRHKGIGYVEMADLEDIPNCLLFNNVVPDFQKFAILVKPSEAEKNFVAKKDPITLAPSVKDGNKTLDPDARLYIGNIHVSITDMALRSVLEQFGQLETVTLHRDELGNSKGFAFARFSKAESAKLAMSSLGGMELAGRIVKVGPVIDASNKTTDSSINNNNNTMGGANSSSSSTILLDNSNQSSSQNWKLDDDDGVTGMQMNSQSRAALMQKLGQTAGIQIPQPQQQPPSTIAMPPVIIGNPSIYIMIRNMFVLEEETEINWHLEIKEDVIDECTKYGKVIKCDIETRRVGGMVYLHFDTIESAMKAAVAMHGRYFAGRMITVSYLDVGQYNALTS